MQTFMRFALFLPALGWALAAGGVMAASEFFEGRNDDLSEKLEDLNESMVETLVRVDKWMDTLK